MNRFEKEKFICPSHLTFEQSPPMLMKKLLFTITCFLTFLDLQAQLLDGAKSEYTRCDSLRGYLYPSRAAIEVFFYDLDIDLNPDNQSILGHNQIYFKAISDADQLQFDLYANLRIDSVIFDGESIEISRECNAFFLPVSVKTGASYKLDVYYGGKPIIARRAPWDGGFTWSEDENGVDWIGTSVQGMGASLFWPCKDHLSDEPDSMRVSVTLPKPPMYVGNGRMESSEELDEGRRRFTWFISYPINLYNVSLNIANYVHFGDLYSSESNGKVLDLDYYVLPENLSKAKVHFEQVKPMLACYEEYFGPFPFWEDGFKLVETPYLGMEHQTAIAYGNGYQTGYMGRDYSRIGLDFDYIIIHETGHEYWGNNVSCADVADLWIHEGFCTYSEAVYVECLYGYEKALDYVNAKKSTVGNKYPMRGVYHVHEEGSGDMYSKGMLFLNTMRHIINDEELWWDMLKDMQTETFALKTISTDDLLQYMESRTGMDLDKVFEQYLDYPAIPKLVYEIESVTKKRHLIKLNWETDVEGFSMPVRIATKAGQYEWVTIGPEGYSLN
jgi:aminopeptidase N